MLIDLAKYKLLKKLEEEAEKTARYIEFLEMTTVEEDLESIRAIDRAVLRYYALLRRIENMRYQAEAAEP